MASFGAGLGLLVAVGWYGFSTVDLEGRSVAPGAFIVLAGLAIATLGIVSTEFRLLARITGVDIGKRNALDVTVIGTIANLLPLPGSAITRFVVLQRAGAPSARITRVLLGGAVLWLGIAGVVAAIGMLVANAEAGFTLAAGGVLATGAGLTMLARSGATRTDQVKLATVEIGLTMLGLARFVLAAAVIELEAPIREVAALAAAGPTSAAVGFVPAGIGVRESLAAGLGSLSGLGAATAATIAVIDRAVGLTMLIPVYLVVNTRRRLVTTP